MVHFNLNSRFLFIINRVKGNDNDYFPTAFFLSQNNCELKGVKQLFELSFFFAGIYYISVNLRKKKKCLFRLQLFRIKLILIEKQFFTEQDKSLASFSVISVFYEKECFYVMAHTYSKFFIHPVIFP